MNVKKFFLCWGKNSHELKESTRAGTFWLVRKSNDSDGMRTLCEWSKGRRWLAQRANWECCSEEAFARCASDAPVRVVQGGYSAEATARTQEFVGFCLQNPYKPKPEATRRVSKNERGGFVFLVWDMESVGSKNKKEPRVRRKRWKQKTWQSGCLCVRFGVCFCHLWGRTPIFPIQ